MRRSPQCLQVAPDAASAPRRRGPASACGCPGLISCGSAIQPARCPDVLGSVPAASVRRPMRWVRSGPNPPARRAADGVAGPARRGTARLRPDAVGRMPRQAPPELRVPPTVEIRRWLAPPPRIPCEHAATRNTRRTGRETRLVAGLDPGDVGLPGDQVGLAAERRHPEGVDHIGADEPDSHRLRSGCGSRSRCECRAPGRSP